MFSNRSQALHCVKKMNYLCNSKSEMSNVCNAVEDHCFQAVKIVYHYANNCFDWLISGHLIVNRSREAISILSGKFHMFVHPVDMSWLDVRVAFPSGLVRSYLDFLLSFDYPLKVLIPLKVIAKASSTRNVDYENKLH